MKLTLIEQKRFKQLIKLFLENENPDNFDRAGITNIKFICTVKIITIIVYLYRPGYLIGEKGIIVNTLVQFIYNATDEKRIIKVNVKQTPLWE